MQMQIRINYYTRWEAETNVEYDRRILWFVWLVVWDPLLIACMRGDTNC